VKDLKHYSFEHDRSYVIALVGTKHESIGEKGIQDDPVSILAQRFATRHDIVWMETDAKKSLAVKELFNTLATTAVLAAEEAGAPIRPIPHVCFDTASFAKKVIEESRECKSTPHAERVEGSTADADTQISENTSLGRKVSLLGK
tara:strand:- start:803 stop:1237 length:435 start_codon:yes stop_codon:yes gene_type:complete